MAGVAGAVAGHTVTLVEIRAETPDGSTDTTYVSAFTNDGWVHWTGMVGSSNVAYTTIRARVTYSDAKQLGVSQPVTYNATSPPPSPPPLPPSPSGTDPFGMTMLRPTRAGGSTWTSNFNIARGTLGNVQDPVDPWLSFADGDATYTMNGDGKLRVADNGGARIYVTHPDKSTEWAENLEITGVFTLTKDCGGCDDQPDHYVQIYSRTNHAQNIFPGYWEDGCDGCSDGTKNKFICDDRGYGATILYNGTWFWEKETCHHCNGYAQTGNQPGGINLNQPVYFKVVTHNDPANTKTTLDFYKSSNQGQTWTLVTRVVDTGNDWGDIACMNGVDPKTRLTRNLVLPASLTGKPFFSVYFRTEPGDRSIFEKLSIREIDPF